MSFIYARNALFYKSYEFKFGLGESHVFLIYGFYFKPVTFFRLLQRYSSLLSFCYFFNVLRFCTVLLRYFSELIFINELYQLIK